MAAEASPSDASELMKFRRTAMENRSCIVYTDSYRLKMVRIDAAFI